LPILLCWFSAYAKETGLSRGPVKWGLGICGGENWSPDTSNVDLISIHVSALFDRDPFFPYKPARRIRWLLEMQTGSTIHQPRRFFTSAGMLVRAQIEPAPWAITYALAGIGIIYTDFQVKGQGLRINFNPQLGVGMDIKNKFYFQIRWNHISNGGLHKDNTGVNHWVVLTGIYF
jgi:lipid A 3-O-deacylase